jgi:alpha-1,6-mannosyltransferase
MALCCPSARDAARAHLVDSTMFWSPQGAGVQRYLLTKRAWMAARTHWRHTIVAPGVQGAGFLDCGGVPLPMSGGYRVVLRRALAAGRLRSLVPDLIEVADPYRLAWAALDVGQEMGVPCVAFCHSNAAALAQRLVESAGLRAGWARRAASRYLARLYAQFDLVLASSHAMVEELRGLGVACAVQYQPLGVETAVFHPGRRDPAWRQSLGIPSGARLLLYAGRFAPEKNLAVLERAVQLLGAPYVLLAVGHGPRPPAGARVRVLPHVDDPAALARIMASVDAFVHAGDQETFGLAALEAMACGTPVVLRDAAGLGELVRGHAGIAVPSADPQVWAEAVGALFDSARDARVEAARARALSLDWARVFPALLRRYALVLQRRELCTIQLP